MGHQRLHAGSQVREYLHRLRDRTKEIWGNQGFGVFALNMILNMCQENTNSVIKIHYSDQAIWLFFSLHNSDLQTWGFFNTGFVCEHGKLDYSNFFQCTVYV